jgi:O-antigen/teichoic acid export membrane protein
MLILSTQRILTLILVPVLFEFAGVNGAILGFAISHLVLCKNFFRIVREIDFSISTLKPIKKYFLHSYLLGISKTLPYFADKLIILPLFGLSTLGYYQFGVQMLTVTAVIPVILYNYLLPRVARSGTQDLSRTIWLGLITALSMSSIMYLFMPTIVSKFFPTFESAILSVQIILFAGIPLTAVAIITSVFMGQQKSIHVAVAALLFIGCQYLLIILLGKSFGLIGLSASMLAASSIQCTYLLLIKRTAIQTGGSSDGKQSKNLAS